MVPQLAPSTAQILVPDVSRSLANVIANGQRHRRDRIRLDVALDAEAEADAENVMFIVNDDGPGITVPICATGATSQKLAR